MATLTAFKKIELFGLYSLAFTLPIMESPKHFAFVLFLIGAISRRVITKPFSWRKPDIFEVLLIGMWLISFASTLVNWPFPNGVKGLKTTTCLVTLFWAAYRGDYTQDQIRLFIGILIGGVMVGLVWGLWEWHSGLRSEFEFHSAGIVTQSSIYLGITIILMIGVFFDVKFRVSKKIRAIIALCTLFSLLCLFLMGSRGGVLGVLMATFFLAIAFFHNPRFRKTLALGTSIIFVLILGAFLGTGGSDKITYRINHLIVNFRQLTLSLDGLNDRFRIEHWMVAYAQATQGGHPLLGIGPRNFTSINVAQLRFKSPLVTYPTIWKTPHHAHNLFLTKWAEEGLLGLIIFILFLSQVTKDLFLGRPRNGAMDWSWTAGLGALVVPVVAGFFNSSFANEFAWLSMLLTGYSMSRIRNRRHGNASLPI